MQISIIIPTYNRAIELAKLLADLLTQVEHLAIANLELIVVDNNSTDNTKQIVQAQPSIKYIFEANQGVSFARNSGIINSTGDLVVFLDDDVRLASNWLQVIYDLAKDLDLTKPLAFGSRVIPDWQSKPSWIKFSGPFAISQSVFPSHDFGEHDCLYPFTYNGVTISNPIGACMIFTRKVFELFGDFRVDLGPGLAFELIHEDTEYFRYLINQKIETVYLADCVVYHPVSDSRTAFDYICEWYYKSGLSMYFMSHNPREASSRIKILFIGVPLRFKGYLPNLLETIKMGGVPLYLFAKIVVLYILYLLTRLCFWQDLTRWLLIYLAKTRGEIAGAKLISIRDSLKRTNS